jgi:hypothetical protein
MHIISNINRSYRNSFVLCVTMRMDDQIIDMAMAHSLHADA